MPEELAHALEGAEVLAHDSASFLERAREGPPEDLRATLRLVRKMLADALDALDEAAPLAEDLRNDSP